MSKKNIKSKTKTPDNIRTLFIKAKVGLDELLDTLPRNGCSCNCELDERKVFRYIHDEGDFDEIMEVCLNCGGFIE